jgi:hypothetical protein
MVYEFPNWIYIFSTSCLLSLSLVFLFCIDLNIYLSSGYMVWFSQKVNNPLVREMEKIVKWQYQNRLRWWDSYCYKKGIFHKRFRVLTKLRNVVVLPQTWDRFFLTRRRINVIMSTWSILLCVVKMWCGVWWGKVVRKKI